MVRVIREDRNRIEIELGGRVDSREFVEVVRRLESMSAEYPSIRVLLNAANLERYRFRVILKEHELYRQHRRHLERVAIVSDRLFETFALRLLSRLSATTEVRSFPVRRAAEARDWIWR